MAKGAKKFGEDHKCRRSILRPCRYAQHPLHNEMAGTKHSQKTQLGLFLKAIVSPVWTYKTNIYSIKPISYLYSTVSTLEMQALLDKGHLGDCPFKEGARKSHSFEGNIGLTSGSLAI
jgi:hypothetical protein